MHVGEGLEDLEDNGPDGGLAEQVRRLPHEAEQVALDVLEHEVETVVFPNHLGGVRVRVRVRVNALFPVIPLSASLRLDGSASSETSPP